MIKDMASSCAERQRRHRALVREGKIKLYIAIDEVRMAAMLSDEITGGVFLETDSPSPEELAVAIERFLEAYVTRYEKDRYGVLD